MKKFFLLLFLGTILTSGVFADHPTGWGLGIMGRGGWLNENKHFGDASGGLAVSLKIPKIPIFWSIDLDFYHKGFGVGLSGDFYFVNVNLIETTLGWYLGIGAFANLAFFSGGAVAVGGRLPVGLSLQVPLSTIVFEMFLAVVPRLGAGMSGSSGDLYYNIGGELGVRFWF